MRWAVVVERFIRDPDESVESMLWSMPMLVSMLVSMKGWWEVKVPCIWGAKDMGPLTES